MSFLAGKLLTISALDKALRDKLSNKHHRQSCKNKIACYDMKERFKPNRLCPTSLGNCPK